MPVPEPTFWSDLLRRTLACYDEELLRQVVARLVRPRNQWPVEDLIERSLATADNPAVLDRRLQDLEPAGRQALALIGHSRQPCWSLGNLVEALFALGHSDGLRPIFTLLESGLLYPYLPACSGGPLRPAELPAAGRAPLTNPGDGRLGRLRTFEQWLGQAGTTGLYVFTLPLIASRVIGEDLGLPDLQADEEPTPKEEATGSLSGPSFGLPPSSMVHEADGLEWLLRLGVLWQQVAQAPLRRTQQGGFFKRDFERLAQDPLLNGPPADQLVEVPDPGLLAVVLAELEGIVQAEEGELRVGTLPASWEQGLAPALESLWADLPRLQTWNPLDGWRGGETLTGNPFPSACLLACLLLARLPQEAWARSADLEEWLVEHHPYWAGVPTLTPPIDEAETTEEQELVEQPTRLSAPRRPAKPWVGTFLLGLAYQLRVVQAKRDPAGDGWLVRLSPAGRWLLGLGEQPSLDAGYGQTLLVQPNLEIIAYRQGLTAGLIARLTQFASWKGLGAACTLQLEPETVYRALEAGQTFDSIRLTLEQHATRALPPAVLDSLRTWSDKRDRITVYPSATLLEFPSAEDLNEALARGLAAVRLADTLAVAASEEGIDFRHFRLTGTRDYALPPEKCVTVEPDGVTLTVDQARSDLLLETELPRFAEPLGGPSANGRRQYRLTPASLAGARAAGLGLTGLEVWFAQRTGAPLPPAVRLLLTGSQAPPPRLERHLVLHVASAELADGLLQWPQTHDLLAGRLGPTALIVPEDRVETLRQRLSETGIALEAGPDKGDRP
jgi:hypothetical protein